MLDRLLLVASGGGGFLNVGYTMTADEVAFWQDQAALLDPDAYVLFLGNTESETVPGGERWYLVNGWNLKATGEGTTWYHRPADVKRALMLPEGTTIETATPPDGTSTAFMYICQPSLVTGSDARYTSDPRGLYFDRIMKLATLDQERIGGTATAGSIVNEAFPATFTDGMIVHASVHDVAWMILWDGSDGLSNLHNEISDSTRIRWAEPLLMPFKRTTFPNTAIQGVSLAEGRATLSYVVLDGTGW